MENKRPLLCVIDASSLIFRAYYAIRGLSNKSGLPTNAILGFANMLVKALEELRPDYLVVVYDTKHPSFRKEIFSEYKANRGTMPEDLVPQIPYIKRLVQSLNLVSMEKPGFEADDIIAALAKFAEEKHKAENVCILTGDKDLMQLVSDKVFLFDTMKDKRTERKEVEEKLGVPPEQVPDYLGLVGDSSDNIPGVNGIGPKAATTLLKHFGSIENIYKNINKVEKEKQRELLLNAKEQAFLSKKLATVNPDVDIEIDWQKIECKPTISPDLQNLVQELGFQNFYKHLTNLDMVKGDSKELQTSSTAKINAKYHCVQSLKDLEKIFTKYKDETTIAFDTETTSLRIQEAEIVGFSFCCNDKEAFYVPVGHVALGGVEQCPLEETLEELKKFLRHKKLIGQNLKYDSNILRSCGIVLDPKQIFFDTMIASYVLQPEERHGLDYLTEKYLQHKNISYEEVCGEGKNQISFSEVPLDKATDYAAEDAYVTYRLYEELLPKLKAEPALYKVFTDIEMPLVSVLAEMEWEGVSIDIPHLKKLSHQFSIELARLEKHAYQLAGEEFNLASPKQLQKVLFENLKLPTVRKTKTGYSTDVDVLQTLAIQHELPAVILNHREISKLKNTYVDVLPGLVSYKTKRVHASFNQTVAATGRLSSSDPNLQNIPIRTELGKKIREAFIAREGFILVGADYSQIELRLLAFCSRDEALLNAFKEGKDIHSMTAVEVLGAKPGQVTAEDRRRAKAINFGLIYGKTAFGLSEELGIPRSEAAHIIEKYFARYPTIKAYLNSLIEKAHTTGYAETLYGRRRTIENIRSSNKTLRAMADRMAVNAPLQGTAADIIKLAMCKIAEELRKRKLEAKLILQVHDELVIEAPKAEEAEVKKLLKEKMEGVGHFAGFPKIDVPLTVEIGVGHNWLVL